ncbi:formyl transferase [Desulfosarcina ovata]|uniref:phosphoribosylglycinamide formyltransferase 1 n=1 Tax=Desulfosarcina ovata subsp. ovata TaxID=2752305 RepID=A0A5K8A7S3_9BACT|nr:formyl transferase [Desulfosarcina ovata]BBO88539.1 hypothetical protein DSCOOX_17190 [Desulfosarcina ovata subsp. ovata]
MSNLRIVVLVSSDPSDIYFANQLIKELNVVGVIIEDQKKNISKIKRIYKLIKMILTPILLSRRLKEHFITNNFYKKYGKKITESNDSMFGEESKRIICSDSCSTYTIYSPETINSKRSIEYIKSLRTDLIAVCGTSIIKNEILSIPKNGVLNLHGGLSQKYRGLWTTHWALINKEPEYIGATVHYVTSGIDDGSIVYQSRPIIQIEDNPETLYAKVVKIGIKMMIRTIKEIQNGTHVCHKLKIKGDLYLSEMMNVILLEKSWKNIEKGILSQYIDNKEKIDIKLESITNAKSYILFN